MSSSRTRSAIKMAKSEMWVRSDQKDLERLAHSLGPPSHSQRNRSAVFMADSELSYCDFGLILTLGRGRHYAITFHINKANLASMPRPKPTKGQFKGEAKRLAVITHRDSRKKAGA